MTVATTAHDHAHIAYSTDRGPWRMDPPPPGDLHDLLAGAWPGALVALVAMLLLGLLLAFGSVVSDGVRRGDRLRSQALMVDTAGGAGPAAHAAAITAADADAAAGVALDAVAALPCGTEAGPGAAPGCQATGGLARPTLSASPLPAAPRATFNAPPALML